MSSYSSTALTTTTTNNTNPSNTQNNNNDPYLTNDYHPLSLVSSEILVALRSDESNINSDLYRRLISSSSSSTNGNGGAHQYYVVDSSDHGCGNVDTTNNNNGGSNNDDGNTPRQTSDSLGSTHGNIIGSPLGVLRNANRQSQRSSSKNTNSASPSNNTTITNKSSNNKPPTSYLKHTKSIPLPTQLSTIKSSAKLSTFMGLLTEVQLVWCSVDDKLYLWSYKNSCETGVGGNGGVFASSTPRAGKEGVNNKDEYCSFTIPSGQCIVSVGLVKPKKNIFKSQVKWCLVVTTPEEVILCAISIESIDNYMITTFDDGNPNEPSTQIQQVVNGGIQHGTNEIMKLIPTRYIVPTDSIPITKIVGSSSKDDGRIFLGGYDGNLYEFMYEGNNSRTKNGSSLHSYNGGGGSEVMEQAIDDYFDGRGVFKMGDSKKQSSLVNGALSGSKRVLSALTFGILDDASNNTLPSLNGISSGSGEGTTPIRARKCRKINHSSTASSSSVLSSIIPEPVMRVATNMFSSSIDAAAKKLSGPIVDIVVDEERLCLYTLGSKGVICVYDIAPLPSSSGSQAAPPRLTSVLDAIGTSKLYLDSVSRGRMYPPTTSNNVSLGTITFPGGVGSAQAGVGGMEGAREILKRYDLESRIIKSATAAAAANNNNNNGGMGKRGVKNELSNTAGILHPVSIHLVPQTESKSLTLVAITGGGLRYYLSSLTSSYINSAAQAGQGGFNYTSTTQSGSSRGGANLDPRLARMRPGRKMIFCHVRAPPPYTSTDGNDGFRFELSPSAVNLVGAAGSGGGLPPGIHGSSSGRSTSGNIVSSAAGDVVKGSYGNGVFVLALDIDKKRSGAGRNGSGNNFFSTPDDRSSTRKSSVAGDTIVVSLPDFANRVSSQSNSSLVSANNNTSTVVATTATQPGGISESVELPMAGINGNASPVLPGGRTFDISTNSNKQKSSVVSLFVNSETPTDVELQVGLLPSFIPKKKATTKPKNKASTSSALVVSTDRGSGVISSALSSLSYYIRSGQAFGFPVGTVSNGSNFGPTITYRVSKRYGCDSVGFSSSAGESYSTSRTSQQRRISSGGNATSTASAKSARLPAWLLRPSPAPLNAEASQHLLPQSSSSSASSSDVLVLNSGGLHFFSNSSLLNNLASVLLRANNVAKDSFVRNFFTSYGYVEGCAMCFALATSSSSSAALRGKAEQAVLCYAHRPSMKLTGPNNGMAPISSYTFQPSSLYEGLVKFISRLLRPFWYKPSVVVTEGRPIHSKSAYTNYYAALPSKVELLLDDLTLEEIRRPLVMLQTLMKKTFVPVLKSVPGAPVVNKGSPTDAMDVDDNSGGLITRAMQNQARAATQRLNNNSQHAATPKEIQTKAFDTEDRNMHSLYRLLSRCVQVLNLMSCLKRAHETPSLPEVQWGLLHGLTYYQLVTSPEGQARVEALLNALVSQGEKTLVNGLSTDGDQLAETLSRQCYLYFSSASRLTYLGFRSANDSLSRPITSPQRNVLSNQAASYLRAAARHWYSPAMIAGRKMATRNAAKDWQDVAAHAKEVGSPLALAADILMKLGNVEGLADVCLICASNFGGAKVKRDEGKEMGEENTQDMLGWEKGLYHRPPSSAESDLSSQAIVTGIDVTPSDALRTCHAIIFHYISKLLGEGSPSGQRLAEELVATCAGSTDIKFLYSLYEYLLSTNNVETALRIDSSSLENWLVNEKKDINLLWKYYSFHKRNVMAGDVMFKEATAENKKVPLDQRIECLTRAANSFSSALEANGHSVNMSRLFGGGPQAGVSQALEQDPQVSVESLNNQIGQIQELLDVSTIQKRVLTTISQSQEVNLDEAAMDDLAFTLLNVSILYNEYACKFNLFDVCLLILETCRTKEVSSITCLWKSIICEEVLPCSTNSEAVVEFLTTLKQGSMLEEETIVFGSSGGNNIQLFEAGEWIPRLRNRVTSLGKELFGKGADYTFPLDLLVNELEGLRQVYYQTRDGDNESQPWPAQAILDADVPFYMLLETLDASTAVGVDATTQLQRLGSISELLELWVVAALASYGSAPLVGSAHLPPANNASNELSRAINLGLLQRIEQYRSALEGLVGVDTAPVQERFVNVEEGIRKNFT